MKILLIGAIYSDNLGDAILCQCTKYMLQEIFPESEIKSLDIWGATEKNNIDSSDNRRAIIKKICTKLPGLVQIKNYIRKKERYNKLQNIDITGTDLVVYAGGQLFQSCFINELEYLAYKFEKLSIPVIYNAIGYDYMRCKDVARLSKLLCCNNVIAISTRDSVKEAQQVIKTEQLTETYDPALILNEFYRINKNQGESIGIGVLSGKQKQIIAIIKQLNSRGIEWRLFCNGDADDYRTMQDILAITNEKEDKALKRPLCAEELIEEIAGFKGIIAFRLHASVIATALHIPCIGLSWNRKVQEFYSKLGIPDYCFNESASAVEIVDTIESILLDYKTVNLDKLCTTIKDSLTQAVKNMGE